MKLRRGTKNKRIMTGILSTALMASMISGCGAASKGEQAASADNHDNYKYEILSDDTVRLTEYTGNEETIRIPDSFEGKTVSTIGESCFAGNIHAKRLTVPEGVTSIEDYAFECCSGMQKVYLPESLTTIGDGAFSGCGSLTMVDMQDHVESIGKGAFLECDSLLTFIAPYALTEIGDFAFADCNEMIEVKLWDSGVKEIPNRCFLENRSLYRIKLPQNMETLAERAMESCESLNNIYFPDTLKNVEDLSLMGTALDQESVYFPEGATVSPDLFYMQPTSEQLETIESGVVEAGSQEAVAPDTRVADHTVAELEQEAESKGYRIVHSEDFDAWADDYIEYNGDNILTTAEENVYITKYKGEVGGYYIAMTALASQDPEAMQQAKSMFGDDFTDMYEMVNHGLSTEIRNFKMQENLLLYTGVYDHQLKAAAGTDHIPSLDELKNCIGNTFTDNSLTSTTTDPSVAADFGDTLFIIYASADAMNSTGTVSMDAYMRTPEKEILMDSGASYKILDVGVMEVDTQDMDGNPSKELRNYVKVELLADEI